MNEHHFLKQLLISILKFILVSLFFHMQNKDLHNTTNFASHSQNTKLSVLKVILNKIDTLFLQFNQIVCQIFFRHNVTNISWFFGLIKFLVAIWHQEFSANFYRFVSREWSKCPNSRSNNIKQTIQGLISLKKFAQNAFYSWGLCLLHAKSRA